MCPRHREGAISECDQMLDGLSDCGGRVTADQTPTPNADSGPVIELQPKLGLIGFRLRPAGPCGGPRRATSRREGPPWYCVGASVVESVQHCRSFVAVQPSAAVESSVPGRGANRSGESGDFLI